MTYHYHFFMLLAKWMVDHSDYEITQRMWDTAPIWCRYKYSLPYDGDNSDTEKIIENQPYDILSYSEVMTFLLNTEGTTAAEYIAVYRRILLTTIMLMNKAMPIKIQPSWTNRDFDDAEEFFRAAYPIAEEYSKLADDSDDGSDKFYKNPKYLKKVVQIYQTIEVMSKQIGATPSFADFRGAMQASRKERNTHK